MKLALLGYGQMGQMIEEVALKRKHTIIAAVDMHNPNASHKQISEEIIKDADVCIDFTLPDSIIGNIKKAADFGKNIVVGTTGWYDQIDEVKAYIEKKQTGLIYAPNFSLGVHIFCRILEYGAKLFNFFEEYDVAGIEYHHSQKAESPSGTARALADIITTSIDRKTQPIFDKVDRKINENELHFSTIRCGHMPGTHTIQFDSESDTITLSHQARNRKGFALGAVYAAEWIMGKHGFYDLSSLIEYLTEQMGDLK